MTVSKNIKRKIVFGTGMETGITSARQKLYVGKGKEIRKQLKFKLKKVGRKV